MDSETLKPPTTANADEWALFLSEATPVYAAVQICEMLDALTRLRGAAVPEGPRANTEEELREMMKDKRYWRDRDPAFIRAVADGYRRLYHGKDNSRAAPKPEVPR